VFNLTPQPEPTKEEIGLSSLESPALSIQLGAVRINGEIFKRWSGVIFGFSNVVINATPQPKPTEGFKAEPFWHPAPFPTLLSSPVAAMFQGLP